MSSPPFRFSPIVPGRGINHKNLDAIVRAFHLKEPEIMKVTKKLTLVLPPKEFEAIEEALRGEGEGDFPTYEVPADEEWSLKVRVVRGKRPHLAITVYQGSEAYAEPEESRSLYREYRFTDRHFDLTLNIEGGEKGQERYQVREE